MHFLLISTSENCLLKQISLIATLINILGSFTQENEIMHPFQTKFAKQRKMYMIICNNYNQIRNKYIVMIIKYLFLCKEVYITASQFIT